MSEKDSKQSSHSFVFYLWFIINRIYSFNPGLSVAYFVFALVTSFLPQIESFTLGKLIDSAVNTVNTVSPDPKAFIGLIVLVSGVLLVNKFIFDVNSYVTQIFNLRNQNVRDTVGFQAILNAKTHYFEDPEFIKEKNKVDYNSWKIPQVIESTTIVVTSLISAFIIIVIFFNYDWKIVVTALVSLILPIYVKLKFGKQVWGIWDSMSEDKVIFSKYRNRLYTDNPSEFTEMKVFGYGKFLLNTALHLNKKFIDKLEVNEKRRLLFTLLSRLWEFVFTVGGFYFVFQLLLIGRVSIGQFFFVVTLFQSMRSVVTFAVEQLTVILTDGPFFKTFYNFLNFKPKVEVIDGTKSVDVSIGIMLEFRNVSFKYPGTDKMVLKNINMLIPADKDIALVGKNGAGKTTLIKLLLRTYDPTEGEILVNGENIKELSLIEYYKKIGILSQDFNTFGFRAWENIFTGDVDAPYSLENIERAAKNAQAHDFISEYPKKYDTYLARDIYGGVAPSGGQWQRIAISRVFYRDPKLIILDEPTSAIDALAEEEIFSNIKEFAKDKTVVMVSHRFATVKKADYIYVIDGGTVVEQGTHAELLSKSGLYSQMYNSQNS